MKLDTLIPAKYTEVLGNIVDYYGINIFDFEYTLPDNAGVTKDELQRAFIDRFYFREIGQETIQMFLKYLQTTWTERIAFYAPIFVAKAQSEPTDLSNDEYMNSGKNVYNAAPKGVVDFDNNHATSYNVYDSTTKGRRGRTKAEIIRAFHDVAFNPTTEFLDELDELFMQIF